MYLGNEKHLVFTGEKEVELTEEEMREIFLYAVENEIYLIKRGFELIQKTPKKKYHKSQKIKTLFNKYHKDGMTKKEVFIKIANELNITYKAVEKSYYKKV
jgi:N-acetylglutamate synthase-like GNAT family acetyltransferase